MRETLLDHDSFRPRDPARERRERQRYWLLAGVFERAGGQGEVPVSGLEVGEALGLSREDTFRLVQVLAQRGFLNYMGAGPRVGLTEAGIRLLTRSASRRKSIRDE